MKAKFDAYLRKLSRTPFDAIPEPAVITIIGAPVIFGLIAIGICILVVREIVRLSKEKKGERHERED